jgi:histidyl-tRNA synthetase
LNHRQILNRLLEHAGIDRVRYADALVAIDKLDKIGPDGVTRELVGRGISESAAGELATAFTEAHRLEWLRERAGGDAPLEALATIETIMALSETTAAAGRVKLDPSLARGLSYYTGAIMEIAVPDLAGSLGGGGRYDNLVGMFLGRDVPACGFSLGLERIIVVMTERGMFPATVSGGGVDVMVTIWNDASRAETLALAGELRRAGLRVDVYPEADKLGKQFKYAAARGVPFVAILGDDERARGSVSIKDMRSGDQQAVARGAAAEHIRARR